MAQTRDSCTLLHNLVQGMAVNLFERENMIFIHHFLLYVTAFSVPADAGRRPSVMIKSSLRGSCLLKRVIINPRESSVSSTKPDCSELCRNDFHIWNVCMHIHIALC